MKKIFLITIIFISYFNLISLGQCFDFYVQTPNGGNIKACSSGGYSPAQVQAADAYSRTFAIGPGFVYDAGTNSYNCHGYAWNVKEGGNNVWINNVGSETGNLNTYWNDNSYSVYPYSSYPHSENLRVFYGNDDHTAVTTTNPTVFISKMGCGCLLAHLSTNSPYTGGNFTYYHKGPNYIVGPHTIYFSGMNFNLNTPHSGTVIWEVTAPFTLSPVPGNPSAIRVNRTTATSSGTLKAKDNGGNVIGEKSIATYDLVMSGPSTVYVGTVGNTFYFWPLVAELTYNWYSGGLLILTSSSGNYGTFNGPDYIEGGWASDFVECRVTIYGSNGYYRRYVDIYP